MALTDQLRQIANSAVGGNVVTILARQAIKLNALKGVMKFEAQRAQLESYTPPYEQPTVFVAGVPVSVRQQETYTFQSDISNHAIESGAALTDHVILQPVRVDLSFEVTNWEAGQAEHSLNLLEELWRSRALIDLLTEHKKISDMVLINLQADNCVPNWGRLAYRASFQQIKFVTLQTSKFQAKKVAHTEKTGGPDTSKSNEAPVDNGQAAPRESALKKGVRGLFGGN